MFTITEVEGLRVAGTCSTCGMRVALRRISAGQYQLPTHAAYEQPWCPESLGSIFVSVAAPPAPSESFVIERAERDDELERKTLANIDEPTTADCKWDREGLRCETHGCGFGEPCMKPTCPHCGARKRKRYEKVVTEIDRLQKLVVKWEAKTQRDLSRLLDYRAQLARAQKRQEKMEAES